MTLNHDDFDFRKEKNEKRKKNLSIFSNGDFVVCAG